MARRSASYNSVTRYKSCQSAILPPGGGTTQRSPSRLGCGLAAICRRIASSRRQQRSCSASDVGLMRLMATILLTPGGANASVARTRTP
eukprot:scaffold127523_cov27-Tisochrysis_lutea.AAC.3